MLLAVGEHMLRHPDLSTIHVVNGPDGRGSSLQISAYRHLGELTEAPAVLAWAKTLTDPVIEIRPAGGPNEQHVKVRATGTIAGIAVEVWDVDYGDLGRWYKQHNDDEGRYIYTTISLDQLAAYSAAGTVDGVS